MFSVIVTKAKSFKGVSLGFIELWLVSGRWRIFWGFANLSQHVKATQWEHLLLNDPERRTVLKPNEYLSQTEIVVLPPDFFF